ncbi:hypothetical protein BDA96_03G248800 [Sorghum bicolor]|uniref:Uncharacterized protein n=1 Tax=Sorghum bicolor TaxID=4558 RepID=A0A921RG15_SORBI|nr:hypothetical protein BDA96_03G248800 [Sorghum bicolor]
MYIYQVRSCIFNFVLSQSGSAQLVVLVKITSNKVDVTVLKKLSYQAIVQPL